jgi:hypothetical protein
MPVGQQGRPAKSIEMSALTPHIAAAATNTIGQQDNNKITTRYKTQATNQSSLVRCLGSCSQFYKSIFLTEFFKIRISLKYFCLAIFQGMLPVRKESIQKTP